MTPHIVSIPEHAPRTNNTTLRCIPAIPTRLGEAGRTSAVHQCRAPALLANSARVTCKLAVIISGTTDAVSRLA